jgi:hypothetical protein
MGGEITADGIEEMARIRASLWGEEDPTPSQVLRATVATLKSATEGVKGKDDGHRQATRGERRRRASGGWHKQRPSTLATCLAGSGEEGSRPRTSLRSIEGTDRPASSTTTLGVEEQCEANTGISRTTRGRSAADGADRGPHSGAESVDQGTRSSKAAVCNGGAPVRDGAPCAAAVDYAGYRKIRPTSFAHSSSGLVGLGSHEAGAQGSDSSDRFAARWNSRVDGIGRRYGWGRIAASVILVVFGGSYLVGFLLRYG